MQRTGDFGSNWLQCIEHIVDLAQVYETVYGYTRQLPLVVEGLRLPEKESKGDDLKVIARKFPDWMQRMHEGAAGTKYVDALHVLELIGCRPEELKHGVTLPKPTHILLLLWCTVPKSPNMLDSPGEIGRAHV